MSQRLYIVFIALCFIYSAAEGKKAKKNKRQQIEEVTSAQPEVIAYSSFGFDDAGSYDAKSHFEPTASDHTSFLSSGVNKESATRLYAPAFPTALDATGFGNNYDTQAFDGQSYGVNENNNLDSNGLQYLQNPFNYFNSQTFQNYDDSHRNIGTVELYSDKTEDIHNPIYGAKINKDKTKSSQFNYTEDTFDNQESNNKVYNTPPISNPHINSDQSKFNNQNKSPQNYNSHKYSFENTVTQNTQKPYKFQRVVDFTNVKQDYPLSLDDILSTTPGPTYTYGPISSNFGNDQKKSEAQSNQMSKTTSFMKNNYGINKENSATDDTILSSNPYINGEISMKHETSPYKNTVKYMENKKKLKNKPWFLNKNNTSKNNWRDLLPSKGYEYSTNNINMTFKYEHSEPKKPLSNVDEIVPASSNLVDLTNYHFPESQTISNFKRMPETYNDYSNTNSFRDSHRHHKEFSNPYKNVLSTTSNPHWSNYEVTEFPLYEKHPHYGQNLEEEYVKIPKQYNYHSTVYDNKPKYDWPYGYHNEYKSSRPATDYNHEELTRFKSEEDLLGLRNQDTSHPAYIPTYKPTAYNSDDDDYFKKVADRWRQSYLRSKYRDSNNRDYEGFGSDMKTEHVPVPKPYPIEVPHPVIVPVPQPYPVRVPVSKPVAVPVIHELSIPIEKPVPYPVIKKVPFPIEKLVPVTVEKEVAVPVVKPYPVHIPYVRPVFHHSKPSGEEYEFEQDDEEEYVPQNKKKNVQYRRKPSNTKTRSRRPSRTVYEDRTTRRSPENRRPSSMEQRYRRPHEDHYSSHRYREYENPDREYYHCKRTGRC